MSKFKSSGKVLIALSIVIFTLFYSLTIPAKQAKKPQVVRPQPITLRIVEQQIQVAGKPLKIFSIIQPNGIWGVFNHEGNEVHIVLQNQTSEWTAVHWHGLNVPNPQEDIPFVTQNPVPPGGTLDYRFPLNQSGTFFIESHYTLQKQNLLAAPFIISQEKERPVNADIVMFLQDFSTRDSLETSLNLRKKLLQKQANLQLSTNNQEQQPVEVAMDAYLTNHKTLEDPDVIQVWPADKVRLRIINASTNTNFFIDLGSLQGRAIAVDGAAIDPFENSKFQLAVGQRIDIEFTIPEGETYYPILAQAEGTSLQTGLILSNPNIEIPHLSSKANSLAENLNYSQEIKLRGEPHLPYRNVDHSFLIKLQGNLVSYVWKINGEMWPNVTPIKVKEGERIQLVLNNQTTVALPVHLYGHTFEVTEINGKSIRGAMRDTVLVLPRSIVKVQFDANNPGVWPLRCYVPYLPNREMMTLIHYEGFPIPVFNRKDLGVPPSSSSMSKFYKLGKK